jgi:hypothetical protein
MEIYVHQHNIDHIVNDKEFNEHLSKCLISYSASEVTEVQGNGLFKSTVRKNHDEELFYFQTIDNRGYILNWLRKVILDYCKDVKIRLESIHLQRAWCNRIYRNVKGKPHYHNGTDKGKVLILYYEAPKGSSDFVFINSKQQLDSYEMYDKEQLHFLPVRPGMAIIHDLDVLHAVTEHNSDDPRTVFVFDIKINGKDDHSDA